MLLQRAGPRAASLRLPTPASWRDEPELYLVSLEDTTVSIGWKVGVAADAYRVYEVGNNRLTNLGQTADTAFTLKNVSYGEHCYMVTPMKNNNGSWSFGSESNYLTVKVEQHVTFRLPANLTRMEENALEGNPFVTRIAFDGSAVTSIGDFAFRNCSALRSITIPATVKTIGEDVFSGCSDDLVVYCYRGSSAESYCRLRQIPCVIIGG